MSKVRTANPNPAPKMRPALTPEARENQLTMLAMDLVEQRLRDGTASSQETTHFLKAASSKAKLELRKLELENELTTAKTESIRKEKEDKIAYDEIIRALRNYQGQGEPDEYY